MLTVQKIKSKICACAYSPSLSLRLCSSCKCIGVAKFTASKNLCTLAQESWMARLTANG